MGGNQAMAFTKKQYGGQIYAFAANNCIAYSKTKGKVQINQCKGTGTHWFYTASDKTMR